MLVEHFSIDERHALTLVAADPEDGPLRDFLNAIVWTRLLQKWDDVILRFWVLKTWRYRDLEGVWVRLFGPRPR